MSDDVLKWVVAFGVIGATLAVLGQLAVMLGIYRIAREGQAKIAMLVDRAEPVLAAALTMLDGNKQKTFAIVENAATLAASARESAERVNGLLAETVPRVKARIILIDEAVGVTVSCVLKITEKVVRIVRLMTVAGAAVAAAKKVIGIRASAGRGYR